MKAIRVKQTGSPEVLRLEQVPDLEPGPGELLVDVRASGVNPIDTYIRAGQQGYAPDVPYTPGIDGAGTVKALGSTVDSFRVGDRVYMAGSLTGTYAEQALCSASQAHPLPDRISFAQGAAVYVPYGTAYRALLQRGRGLPGEYVLVHGATGGVGIAAVQLGNAAGMLVIGTAGTEQGRELVLGQGAIKVFDHHTPEHFEAIMAFTQGRGVDVVLEMIANANLSEDLNILAPGGRVVVIGSRGHIEINPRDIMARDADILGMSMMHVKDGEQRQIHAALVAGLTWGTLSPVVRCEMPLGEAAKAHELVMRPGAHGKIVLRP